MARSRLAVVAVLAALVAASPATAAVKKPKPVCNLLTDATGDAGIAANAGGETTYDPSLDIVSADIGVSGSQLTFLIRIKDLTETSTKSPTGRTWSVAFTNGTPSVGLSAFHSPVFGESFSSKKGVVDFARDQVRITIDLKDVAYAKIKKGSVLRGFYVTTNVVVALDPDHGMGHSFAPLSGATDELLGGKAAFVVGSPSCVKVGA